MSDLVMITLIICFTIIFISLLVVVSIRWICVVSFNNKQNNYLTTDEFEEYENIISDALKNLEDKINDKESDRK